MLERGQNLDTFTFVLDQKFFLCLRFWMLMWPGRCYTANYKRTKGKINQSDTCMTLVTHNFMMKSFVFRTSVVISLINFCKIVAKIFKENEEDVKKVSKFLIFVSFLVS